MTLPKLLPFLFLVLLAALFLTVPAASADSSHARIIRLSLVSGDVRFATETHGDPLGDAKANWETAQLNLPIRQGYVLATDNGRAEVEFENGTLAFLRENTVLEFYDLSLKDGALITRLVLRQGSASFHANPASGDYFSVTGGDFTVEASGRSTFRLDNFDDGTAVENLSGHLTVVHQDGTTPLEKGQSLSMKAGGESSVKLGRVTEPDEFDRWVSGQVDAVSNATTAAMQYTNSPYYAAGFGSLYSYGSFFNCGGYGFGWRPFGAGLGWSPFTDGQWISDPALGWTWVSFQPWGWAPYHYGGWLFDSGCGGWFYSPPLVYGYYPGVPVRRFPPRVHAPRPVFHPVTGVFVRNKSGIGLVPMHPLDTKGKTPLNLEHGILSPTNLHGLAVASESGQKWETLKSAPKDAFSNALTPATPPVRVSRTVLENGSGTRVVSTSKDSRIAYDPKEHRFLAPASGKESLAQRGTEARNNMPAVLPPRNSVPPPVPRYSGGERTSAGSGGWGGSRSSGGGWGGSRSSGTSSAGGASTRSAPAPASHASSGGRPH
jgi:FecR protein